MLRKSKYPLKLLNINSHRDHSCLYYPTFYAELSSPMIYHEMFRFARDIYRPVPEIDPQILDAMKMVGTIG